MSTPPGYPPPADPYGQQPGQPPTSGGPYQGFPPPPQQPPYDPNAGQYDPNAGQQPGYGQPTSAPPSSGGPYGPPASGPPAGPYSPPASGPPAGPYSPPPASGPPAGPYAPPPASGPPAPAGPYGPPPSSGGPYGPPPSSGGPYGPPPGGQFGQPGAPYDPNQAAYPTSGFPAPTSGYPGAGYGPDPTGAYPGAPAPARSRRTLLISLIAAVVLVVIAGGGITAFLIFGRSGGEGQANPTAAATNFLTAVYKDKDATKAARYVCSSARDKGDITKKVDEVKAYATKFNRDPQFTWDEPKVENSGKETATVAVTVRFSTSDDRAAEQKLTITTVKDDGWLVCEIKAG
ncbi:Rv0361 family membrane protein [Virgisporangium aurantiacum]|uniref:DUF4878 domain-containing protein n=1 Tax=Virgisporangium aurantiacum TaxID=175570 RepID=A0A8J4DXZ2_9ACTN|nr:hypothetical protein [Virgisporangium aurantiacum]GIJ53893.1 hypothetical protein Vau01_014090 [Virgisporangium aurantiacum]